MSLIQFRSEDDIYVPGNGILKRPVIWVNKIVKGLANPGKTTLAFYLRSEYYSKEYVRTYKSAVEFISEVGGIWKVVFMIGAIIVLPLNLKLMQIALANDMFSIIPPKNKLKEQTYDHYKNLGTITEPHKVIKLHNKSKIECLMTIDYYKYERNKGISYSLTEAMAAVFLAACKPDDIRVKDRIITESNRLILRRLNVIHVLNFSKSVNLLKESLLANRALMIRYNQRYAIHIKNLKVYKLCANL